MASQVRGCAGDSTDQPAVRLRALATTLKLRVANGFRGARRTNDPQIEGFLTCVWLKRLVDSAIRVWLNRLADGAIRVWRIPAYGLEHMSEQAWQVVQVRQDDCPIW